MSENGDIQFSFRLPADLHLPCKKLADENGQTFAEWIRRAMREKLQRDSGPTPVPASFVSLADREVIRAVIREELEKIEKKEAGAGPL